MKKRWVSAFLLIFFSTTSPLLAHTTSTIRGRVTDDGGRPLPGVTIRLDGGGLTKLATSKADGVYELADLPSGRYRLGFQLLSFVSVVKQGVEVTLEKETRLDVALPLSTRADVVVTGKQTFRNLADLTDAESGDLVGLADAASQGVVTARQMEARPVSRAGEVLETVPGVVVSQHSGEGKANQYYLRGFNLDHGTDFSTFLAGVPLNMPTHAHGQGYLDQNFLIPELVTGVQYRKGPYYAEVGDFSAAGSVTVNYANVLDASLARLEAGENGFARAVFATSPRLGAGHLLVAAEVLRNDGPWVNPDDYRRVNGVLRYSQGDTQGGFSLTALAYNGRWTSTDQVAERAIDSGLVDRFGTLDPTDGGKTHRYALSAEWQRSLGGSRLRASAYVVDYALNLYSNFTYFLSDPVNGDQFEQEDRRVTTGLRASYQLLSRVGDVSAETTIGLDVRNDNITNVGLYGTKARERLSTIRADHVAQTSGSLFAQTTVSLLPKLRLTAGLRADLYRFKVNGDRPENAGTETAGLLSPKLGLATGPWASTEIYLNGGYGFHSNDARGATIRVDPASGDPVERVDPLVRARGAEVGVRTTTIPHLQATASLWLLDLDSELLFVGDAGTTEASRPSRRSGVEISVYYTPVPWLTVDADYAHSSSRFRDDDSVGERIPGSPERVASAGFSVDGLSGFLGGVRLRHFGPRPLVEDDSRRSASSTTVNARLGYRFARGWKVLVDVFNLFDSKASDIDYFYTSRLPGEPSSGVDDLHTHPLEPRLFRVGLSATF